MLLGGLQQGKGGKVEVRSLMVGWGRFEGLKTTLQPGTLRVLQLPTP